MYPALRPNSLAAAQTQTTETQLKVLREAKSESKEVAQGAAHQTALAIANYIDQKIPKGDTSGGSTIADRMLGPMADMAGKQIANMFGRMFGGMFGGCLPQDCRSSQNRSRHHNSRCHPVGNIKVKEAHNNDMHNPGIFGVSPQQMQAAREIGNHLRVEIRKCPSKGRLEIRYIAIN